MTAEHPLQTRGRSVRAQQPDHAQQPDQGSGTRILARPCSRVRRLGTPAPRYRLVAAWDDDPDRGRAAAEAVEAAFIDDLDKLLARDDIDAVTVTTATSAHRAIMVGAAQAGTSSPSSWHRRSQRPRRSSTRPIRPALPWWCHPDLYRGYTRAILGQLGEGRLGELTFCRIRLSNDGVIAGWLPEGFYDPEAAVGALSDLGCHPVYLTQLFLGALPATVSATYASFTRRQVEDQAVVTLGYPGGAIGVVETGFLSRDPFTIEMHGTMASLAYDSTENLLRVRSAGEDTWQSLPVPQDDADAFSRWVSHIRDRTRADDNLTRAVELTRLVSTANTAAATGTTVHYPVGAA